MVSYSSLNTTRNVVEKTEDTIRFDLNLPERIYIASYRIQFNPVKNQFDYIATTKTHRGLNGHNGEFYVKFDLDNSSQ